MLFLKKYPHIFQIKSKTGDVIPFSPNKIQTKILDKIENDLKEKGKSWIILPKGRQGGVTTLCQLLGLSYAMSEKAINCYTMAHDSVTARDIFDDKIKFAFDNLPPNLRATYDVKRDNVRQIMFDNMQKAKLTVGTGARGTTQNYLHISEAGKMSEKEKVWKEMISGTLQASKQAKIIIIESTCDGGLGEFYEMVQKALNGKNSFDVLFLSWTDTQEYQMELPKTDEWRESYKELAKQHKLYPNPQKDFGLTDKQFYWYYKTAEELGAEVRVQYPLTLDEAFVTNAKTKFNLDQVRTAMTQVRKPVSISNDVKVYDSLKPVKYVLSIDPSSGLGADFTGIKVRYNDGHKYREFASFKGKVTEQETGPLVVNLYNWISNVGKCLVMQETNVGSYLIDYLRRYIDDDDIYKRINDDPAKFKDQPRADYGWKTTAQNRDLMINKFAELWAKGLIETNDINELKEMEKFIWNDKNRRYEAQSNYHDDLLFADFINIQGFDYINKHW